VQPGGRGSSFAAKVLGSRSREGSRQHAHRVARRLLPRPTAGRDRDPQAPHFFVFFAAFAPSWSKLPGANARLWGAET